MEGVLEQRFGQNSQVKNLLVWCEQKFTPNELAKILDSATEPMTYLTSGAQPSMEACSISVKKDEDPNNFASQLEQEIRMIRTGSESLNNNHPINVIGSEDPFRLTAVRTQVGLKLDEFMTWKGCQEAYRRELNNVVPARGDDKNASEGLLNDKNKKLMKYLQSQYTQTEEKEAIEQEVKWREEGFGHRILNPRMVSMLGDTSKLRCALDCWALGWVEEVEDPQLAGFWHWELKVPSWDYEYWLTPNDKRNKFDEFQALEAFVLVGLNKARGLKDVGLDWVDLKSVLAGLRKPATEGGVSALRTAFGKALESDGLIARWNKLANGSLGATDEVFENPAYHDLADYSARYFKSVR